MKRGLAGMAAAVVASAAAFAADDGTAGEIRLAELDSITVYATKSPMPALDYPGDVTVIDRDEILDFNPSSVSDLFDAVPGARFEGGPRRNGESPTIRGLSGEGVLVFIDGARQSFLSGHDGRFFIDPDLVGAVEVVRGPTSSLYGSGALGGVIALRTITAADVLSTDESASARVGGGYQSVNDEWRASATSVAQSADGESDVVASLTYRTSGDIELGSGFDLPSDDQVLSSLVKATYRANEDLTLSASWIRYGGDSVDPNNPQGSNVGGPGNENVDRDISSDSFQASARYAPAGSSLVDLNFTAFRTRADVEEEEIAGPRVVSRKVTTTGFSIDNRTTLAPASNVDIKFTYGGEFYADEQEGRDSASVDGTRGGVPDAKTRFFGGFAQGELAVKRPFGAPGVLTLIPGVRIDRYENEAPGEVSTDDSAVSPKVGVSYKPVPALILFANWAEAFRAPSFNETYADGVHFQIPNFSTFPPSLATNFFVSNPDLVAEESETFEAGAGIEFSSLAFGDDQLVAKASWYRSDIDNLIDLEVNIPAGCFGAPFPPCGSGFAFGNFSRNVNVTNARIEGFEAEASYSSRYFYARANFATIDGVNRDTGAFVGVLSPGCFFIDAGVKWPRADLRLGARVAVAGDFNEVNDPLLARDGYAKGDVYAVFEPSSGPLDGLRVDLGVDNVTDADFEIVAAGVSEPGRNYKAAVSWRQAF